jgi:hypothetical protein
MFNINLWKNYNGIQLSCWNHNENNNNFLIDYHAFLSVQLRLSLAPPVKHAFNHFSIWHIAIVSNKSTAT